MPSITTVFSEAAIVGVLLIIFIYISKSILHAAGYPTIHNPACNEWNKYHIMETTAFLAGVLFHLSAEYSGLNLLYVKNYVP